MAYWLMKSEPATFSLADLEARSQGIEHWDGVRNFQARNFMQRMRQGDQAFFYHSSCDEPGIVGIVEIVREAYPDFTALDPASAHHDPKSTAEKPIWYMVDVRFRRRLRAPITLRTLKAQPALADMPLLKRGNRLSVMPVSNAQWDFILALENA